MWLPGDEALVQQLFFDAKVTEGVLQDWAANQQDVVVSFVATNGGLTRVFPPG